MLKKSIIYVLICSALYNSIHTMQQDTTPTTIILKTHNEKGDIDLTAVDRASARLSGLLNGFFDAMDNNEMDNVATPIPLSNITTEKLRAALDDLEKNEHRITHYVHSRASVDKVANMNIATRVKIAQWHALRNWIHLLGSDEAFIKQSIHDAIAYDYLMIPELEQEKLARTAAALESSLDLLRSHVPRNEHPNPSHIETVYNEATSNHLACIRNYLYPTPWIARKKISLEISVMGAAHAIVSPDNQHVAVSCGDKAQIFNPYSAQEPLTISINEHIRSAEFSKTGKFAIFTSLDPNARIILVDMENSEKHIINSSLHEPSTHHASISPDETICIVRQNSSQVPIIDIQTKKILHAIRHEDSTSSMATAFFTPKNGWIVTQSYDGITAITDIKKSADSQKQFPILHTFKATCKINEPILPQAFSPDETRLAYAYDNDLILLDTKDFSQLFKVTLERPADHVFFASHGMNENSTIVALSHPGIINFLDAATGAQKQQLKYNGTTQLTMSSDRSKIFAEFPNSSDTPTMMDACTGEKMYSLSANSSLRDLTISPDGTAISARSGLQNLKIFDANTGEDHCAMENIIHPACAFSPDGTLFVATCLHGGVTIAQRLPANTLEQILLLALLNSCKTQADIETTWELPWVKHVLKSYTEEDLRTIKKIICKNI